jgi:hypothetical protein
MGNRLRKQAVFGVSLPTKKTVSVNPSDFLIGGIIGLFERRYKVPFVTRNTKEVQDIFGRNIYPTYYGWDAVTGFFGNSVGVDSKLYIKSHVGYTGSAYDGVSATTGTSIVDGSAAATLRLDSAYLTELEYSASGNRTAYTITNGSRFSTTILTTGTKDDTYVIVNSVAGMKVGDYIKVVATAGGGATVYKKITEIDASTGKVSFSGAFHGSANAAETDAVTIPGFRLRIWRKDINGIVTEVDEDLGAVYCSMEPEVTDYYVQNVFANSKWVLATDLASASVGFLSWPVDVSTVTYLTSGADGTAPTTNSHWGINNATFDNLPIRFLANCETTDVATQKALETYCRGRWDNPKVIYNIAKSQTKSQLITIGNNYQRADDVLGVIIEKWLKVTDPFSTSPLAPYREVPSVGHIMGAWVRSIGALGIHWVPANSNVPLYGVMGLVGTEFTDANDRTDLAEAGVNTIINISGVGYVMATFYTPSVTKEFMFGNGILMREYVKISVVDSQLLSYDEPNTFRRIQNAAVAIQNFYYRLWDVGSTGSVPEGETFGQSINSDGSYTKPTDHFFVQADLVNNPQSSIDNGERNLDSWFTYPAPAASIRIGVGLWLRG